MQRGYRDVGYLLAVRLREFRPALFSIRLWRQQVVFLEEHVERNERGAIRAWFKTYYPALMHMIPARRHGEFVAGFIERLHEENHVQDETYEQSTVRQGARSWFDSASESHRSGNASRPERA